MDIISMQIANKILKRINQNYDGMYEVQIATPAQTIFTVTKKYGVGQNTLGVIVDGAYAYNGTNYTETNPNTITFSKPMEGGEVVLFRTEVAGIPTYNNPVYDDAEIRGIISAVDSAVTVIQGTLASHESSIETIYQVLDENTDGSILDTITNLRTQWESADGSLQTLIDGKAETSAVDTLNTEIVNARGAELNLKAKIDSLEKATSDLSTATGEAASSLTARVTALEEVEIPSFDNMILSDTSTGWKYDIKVTDGVLLANLIKVITSITLTKVTVGDIVVGDFVTFSAEAKNQDGSTDASAVVTYSSSDEEVATIDTLGSVSTLKKGITTITATTMVGTTPISDSMTLTVKFSDANIAQILSDAFDLAAVNSLANLNFVDNDLTLPVSLTNVEGDGTVTWATNNAVVITDAGIVTRPAKDSGDAIVTLTASITHGTATVTKDFVVTVLEEAI